MNDRQTDFELLRDFRHGEQMAFTTLMRRHLDLVYATAVRKAGDSAAQEIAQYVFIALARKSWMFGPDDSLAAWLYRATVLEASHWLRGEMRRKAREQTAFAEGSIMNAPEESAAINALLPLLDEGLLSLREKERTALLLRFYEGRSLRELGSSMGISEDTAQKRVATALEKLAGFFQKRGYRTVSAALSATLLEQSATAAPAALATSLTQAFAQLAPPATGGLLGLAARWMSLSKVQCAGVCCAVAVMPVLWEANVWHTAKASAQTAAFDSEQIRLRNTELQADIDELGAVLSISRTALANTEEEARKAQLAAQHYADWKKRVHNKLFSSDYRWPEDCPFVRISKSLASAIQLFPGVSPEGVLLPEMRELLGLSPDERVQIESSIHQHLARLTEAMEANIYPTNGTKVFSSGKLVASASWVIPPLGSTVQSSVDQLQEDLAAVLGSERSNLVGEDFNGRASTGLSPIVKSDLTDHYRQGTVWIDESDGNLLVGINSDTPNGTYSTSGRDLQSFLPDEHPARGTAGYTKAELHLPNFDEPLVKRVEQWLQEQALARLGNRKDL